MYKMFTQGNDRDTVKIIGGGLAGVECAWALLKQGFKVIMYEMRPKNTTGAHKTDKLAELVCSNSLKSDLPDTASGTLKAEMRLLDSLILKCAEIAKVPAGGALAVDRDVLSLKVEEALFANPNFTLIREEVKDIDFNTPTVIACGPLCSKAISDILQEIGGSDNLHFCDAVAPIVSADSIDYNKAYFGARYGKGGDYLNCGMNKEEYQRFYNELINAEVVVDKLIDAEFYESCMPVEVMAKRGVDAIRFGPLRPVGLDAPDGRKFYAVVQLRKENLQGNAYNIVGFQTNLLFPEQKRVFGLIPGLEKAEFLRYGVMHRNSYVNAPKILNSDFSLKKYPLVYVAGQLSGVEGYMESAMSGLIAGISLAKKLKGETFDIPDEYTIIGSLVRYITNPAIEQLQPMNANFGLLPPIEGIRDKKERKTAYGLRAVEHMLKYKELVL